jgi:DNA polymerase elongation subunit (family B)
MNGWLIDAYRHENTVVLWIKCADGKNKRVVRSFQSFIYAGIEAVCDLNSHGICYEVVKRKTYLHPKIVLKIPIPALNKFEYFIRYLEQITNHTITLYNADIKPEQMYLYEHNLCPFTEVIIDDNKIISSSIQESVSLRVLNIDVVPEKEFNNPIRKIRFNDKELKGSEENILSDFIELFNEFDADVICGNYGYSLIPYLVARLKKHNMFLRFHRWDATPLVYRGGKSYWSYNQVRYQDYSVYLHGRLLVDKNTFVGSECNVDGIIEMIQLSGTLFQPTVARSFGAVFQSALVRLMHNEGMIIPYKQKPIEPPLTMFTMLKTDRGGLTIDPKIGFHRSVAELDFVSMFPWLIYNHNISPECMLSEEEPFQNLPDLPIRTSLKNKGLIPRALKPFIDRRMYYQQHPSEEGSRRCKGLKWILVSCYGYLRYREFKLGIPTSHMAICAFARKTLLECMHLAEERGFEVIHGIVDSLYITKENMTEDDVELFRKEVERMTNIPIRCEGIFKWIVFLPSRVDPDRALPATYYGVFEKGDIKARGIEVRQRGIPAVVKVVQETALNIIKDCITIEQIRSKLPEVCAYVRFVLQQLSLMKPSLLTISMQISKNQYNTNIPQKIILEKLSAHHTKIEPGQHIKFIYSDGGPILAEDYKANPDKGKYKKLLIRAVYVLFQPFGFSLNNITELVSNEQQFEFDFKKVCTQDLIDNNFNELSEYSDVR